MAHQILFKNQKFLTIKQEIKRERFLALLISCIIAGAIIIYTIVVSFENARVTHYYYDELAESRIINNGTTAKSKLEGDFEFCFQELETFNSLIDKEDDSALNSESALKETVKKYSLATYCDEIGVLYNGLVYFNSDIRLYLSRFNKKIDGKYMYSGRIINEDNDSYLYFAIPVSNKHPFLQGIIGRVSTYKIIESIEPKTHDGQDSIVLVDDTFSQIILVSSPNNLYRFGGKTNYTTCMRGWVNDSDFGKYLDFTSNKDQNVLDVGESDARAMIYKGEINYSDTGVYYILFMAPKKLLTSAIADLSLTLLIVLYIFIVLFTFTCIFSIIIIFRQKIKSKRENSYAETGLDKDEAFMHDAKAIVLSNPTQNFAIIYMNIKEFNKVNEIYGLKYADEVLQILGERIFNIIDSENEVACYQRGGRFLLLLHGKQDDLVFKITSLNNSLSTINDIENIKLKFSFGIKEIDYNSILELTHEIDKAKFAEKKTPDGEFLTFYDNNMKLLQQEVIELTNHFDDAIKNEEFQIYLQLKWDLKHNDWAGAETLVRWNHPKKGLISPGKFIPLFEENGYITKLDAFVFKKTCQLIRNMIDNGEKVVPISVNLSKRHFANLSFMDTYEQIVNEYNIPHHLIEFEITEGLLMDNIEVFTRFIKVFHENDYFIAMDDFGAGYSSLNMIHQLAFDVIKIDAKFFHSGLDVSNKTIIQAIVDLCHKLGKVVVAEGIERIEEVNFLKEVGCDIIQGYFFAKPLPIEEFKKKLQTTPKIS